MLVNPPSFSASNRQKAPGLLRLLLAGGALILAACSSVGPKSEIVVSVKDQKLGLYESGELKKTYTISTSKFGIGDQPGSYRTPLGRHEVIAKIGHGLPAGAVLKSRHWNGEVLKPNAPGRDPIVSRILWLRGMETANRNAMKRFIYIHGTTEEGNLGRPASFGCIRMGMQDVVDLFNDVGIGAKVEITRTKLPHGHKPEAPKPTPEAEQTIAAAKPQEPAAAPAQPPVKPEVKPEARVGPESPKPGQPEPARLATASPAQPETADKSPDAKTGGWKFWPFSKPRTADVIDVTDTAVNNPAATKEGTPSPDVAPIARSRSKKGGAYKLEKITTSNRRDTTKTSHLHG